MSTEITLTQRLWDIAMNLHWSWQPELQELFHQLDGGLWESTNHNPVALLKQMPAGVPVATVGVNAGKNAGLLAAQILSLADPALSGRLKAWRKANEDKVIAVDQGWQDHGAKAPKA